MPDYTYHCLSCGADTVISKSMLSANPAVCPLCHAEGTLRRNYRKDMTARHVIYDAAGFFATDSRVENRDPRDVYDRNS